MVSDGVFGGIGRKFRFRLPFRRSWDFAYDSDSDSVASENQPWVVIYPVDNAIHLFDNWVQDYNYSGDRKLWSYGGNFARTNYVLNMKCLMLSIVENLFSCLFCLFVVVVFYFLTIVTRGLIQMVSKSFYCSAVWSSISKKNFGKLQLVHNNACRIVAGLMFQKPWSP